MHEIVCVFITVLETKESMTKMVEVLNYTIQLGSPLEF